MNGDRSDGEDGSLAHLVKKADKQAARLAELIDVIRVAVSRLPRGANRKRTANDYSARAASMRVHIDGRATGVEIDGRVVRLSPSLAALLTVLSAECGETADGDDLVGWKPLDEVRRLLKKRTGQAVSRPALNQRIHILRRCLHSAGLPSGLIQTNREFGARFAVSRRPPAEIGRT